MVRKSREYYAQSDAQAGITGEGDCAKHDLENSQGADLSLIKRTKARTFPLKTLDFRSLGKEDSLRLWREWGRYTMNFSLENIGHKALPVCMEFLDLVPEDCLNEETQFTLRMEL